MPFHHRDQFNFGPTHILSQSSTGVAKKHTSCYIFGMKYFSWNNEKNQLLKSERNISFEEVVFHIEKKDVLDIIEHPNREKYKGQRIFIVNINNYAYLVPFIESEREIFLKIIIPSRKATRKCLRGQKKDE